LNHDKTNIQARRQLRTNVSVRKKTNVVYSSIPKSWEWLIIDYTINTTCMVLLGFYIFKTEILKKIIINSTH
jgi:hypothetical protein